MIASIRKPDDKSQHLHRPSFCRAYNSCESDTPRSRLLLSISCSTAQIAYWQGSKIAQTSLLKSNSSVQPCLPGNSSCVQLTCGFKLLPTHRLAGSATGPADGHGTPAQSPPSCSSRRAHTTQAAHLSDACASIGAGRVFHSVYCSGAYGRSQDAGIYSGSVFAEGSI